MPDNILLVIGLDVAAVARSARLAGYVVWVADYFGDFDTRLSANRNLSLITKSSKKSYGRVNDDFSPKVLVDLARKLVDKSPCYGILLTSGLEDHPQALERLEKIAPIIGNSVQTIHKIRNRENFFATLKRQNIAFPETILFKDRCEAEQAAKKLGYPVIVKPLKGFGGVGIRLAGDQNELQREIAFEEGIIQRYIKGIPASASIISVSSKSTLLTINEQILGMPYLGAEKRFLYCGNVVPLLVSEKTLKRCQSVSDAITNAFGLVGTNGIDFVIDEEGQPWVIEVNPRFQGTIECVEAVLGINLVEAHICAWRDQTLPYLKTKNGSCARLILYARKRCTASGLRLIPEIRDIPSPEVIVEEGEPLCSVVVHRQTRSQTLKKAYQVVGEIYAKSIPF